MRPGRREICASLLVTLPLAGKARAADAYEAQRRAMVSNIEQLLSAGAGGPVGRVAPKVLDRLRTIPRHAFVPPRLAAQAYSDGPLPIGHDATISQPFMVAVMTELARTQPQHVVLEVGTGSGYQAAVLSGLVRRVYTIELVEPLAKPAAERLARMGYANVEVRTGDGYQGWPEHAPFDSIVVTAGAPSVPPALVRQLKPGGRMVIPVGPLDRQELIVVDKSASGAVRRRSVMRVMFVPLRPVEGSEVR